MNNLLQGFSKNLAAIEEQYLLLIEALLKKQEQVAGEVNSIKAQKLSTRTELYKRLIRARDYIDSCFSKDITIAELSGVCLLNETYLLRRLKNYFRITPRQYLIKKRMEAARQILQSRKSLSIPEICLNVGYNDPSSFSKLFKKYFRLSPEVYRRKSRS